LLFIPFLLFSPDDCLNSSKVGYPSNQLEKAKKKEAAFIVTFAKREQEVAELKVMHSLSVYLLVWTS